MLSDQLSSHYKIQQWFVEKVLETIGHSLLLVLAENIFVNFNWTFPVLKTFFCLFSLLNESNWAKKKWFLNGMQHTHRISPSNNAKEFHLCLPKNDLKRWFNFFFLQKCTQNKGLFSQLIFLFAFYDFFYIIMIMRVSTFRAAVRRIKSNKTKHLIYLCKMLWDIFLQIYFNCGIFKEITYSWNTSRIS